MPPADGAYSMTSSRPATCVLTCVTAACVAALYLPRVQRSVPGGDSGELITAACELGVAHPPGYPLFTLLSRLAIGLLPFGSPAYSVNLLSSLLGIAAAGALCFTVNRLAGPGPGGVLAGGVFAVSRLAWQWSMVAEVFSLNNLFVGLLFGLAANFSYAETRHKRRKIGQWGALCCGLGLCNQHTLVLYVMVIAPWVLLHLHAYQELTLHGLLLLGLCFLSGFLPYLYLPLSSYISAARWSWGDQTSLSGLLTHLLRVEYGTFSLAKTEAARSLADTLRALLDHVVTDLTLPVLVLAGMGLFLSLPRRHSVLPWLFATMLLLYIFFFSWRANLDVSKPLLLGVVERFWLQSDAVLCILAGLGLSGLLTHLERLLGRRPLWTTLGWAFTAGLLAHLAHSNHRECDFSNNNVVETFAQEVMRSIPQNSIILTRGDLPGNTMRYLHYCLGVRPDLQLVDQEMMTYRWYIPKLGKHLGGVRFPGLWWGLAPAEENAFNLERFLAHNSKNVFVCIGLPEEDPSWETNYIRWPWGVCDQLVPARIRFDPENWVRRTTNMYNWSEEHDSFHPGSWEKVANDEIWQARIKTAFFLFDLAEKVHREAKPRLYELSYMLYKEMVEAHLRHPANWDKNLALASERLLRGGVQGHSADELLTQSIESFTLYLDKEPADPQANAIRDIVSHLLKERQRLWEKPVP